MADLACGDVSGISIIIIVLTIFIEEKVALLQNLFKTEGEWLRILVAKNP